MKAVGQFMVSSSAFIKEVEEFEKHHMISINHESHVERISQGRSKNCPSDWRGGWRRYTIATSTLAIEKYYMEKQRDANTNVPFTQT